MNAAVRRQRTQEERSAETRAKLLDATIECLYELGYARTTTTEIADRAGVSRGAQLHHFPTKAELVTTAVDYLFERRNAEFREAFARLPAGPDRGAHAVDLLWSMVSGPTFYAFLELLVAARTDPQLKPAVAEIVRRFGEDVQKTYHDLFPERKTGGALDELAPFVTFALLEGLALDRIVATSAGEKRIEHALGAWRQLARLTAPPRRE
jgi:AcrR family transcriptional regulator